MRIAIYGAGSLGTILGVYLTEAGDDVELVNRNKAHIEALKQNGATITGPVQKNNVHVNAKLPDEMRGKYDVIFLMTKQQHNAEVAAFLKPFLAESGVLCTMQNGIPEPGLREILGPDRVLGATVTWGATMLSPGVCELTSDPEEMSFGMGTSGSPADAKLPEVVAILEHMCPVELEENFDGVRWSKLLINAAFSGTGTALGMTFGEVADDKKSRHIAQYVMKECLDAGRASGVVFAKTVGKDVAKLMDYNGALKKRIAYMLIPLAIKKHRSIKPSMLQDIEHGKKTEIDSINGEVSQFGRKTSIKTPFNDKIVEVVHKIEAGELAASAENLALFDGLLAAAK